MLRTEEWVAIEEFPMYSVNALGHVKNNDTDHRLSVRVNQDGIPYVGLVRGLRQYIRSLPRLVANTYISQPHPAFNTPINLNGDRTDCRVENLMWRPRWYARFYNNQFKERYHNPIDAPVRDAETDDIYPNSLAAACTNGLLERDVVLSILNQTVTWPTYQRFVLHD